MKEYQIQNRLSTYLQYEKHHHFITPNITNIFCWECDMVSITSSGLIHEYEIKRSKADFKNDVKKVEKHDCLKRQRITKNIKHAIRPNYFWYVVYGFDLDIDDVPEYAGLITITVRGWIRIVKEAPRISKIKITDKQREKLYQAVFYRYWNERKKKDKEGRADDFLSA